jgi:hypothetical protein
LTYPLISTRSGINLHGGLDPCCVGESTRLGEELFAGNRTLEAMTICHQVLTTNPGHEQARQLLKRVVHTVLGPDS